MNFVCLLIYLQYRAGNIGGNFSCLFDKAEIQIQVNRYECSQKLSFSPGNLFLGLFTNHNTRNYMRRGINITTNQTLSATFRGNGNTIFVAIHRCFLSRFFIREGGRVYTG